MTKLGMEVLQTLDRAKTQGYHFRSIIIAGMGFFTDAYDLFSISTVTKLLGRLYYYDPAINKPGVLPPGVLAGVTGVALVGTLLGQLFFGWAGDKFGRKKVYGITLLLMVIMSLASGLSLGSTTKSTMTTLCFFRFWLGFGIGGDYPLSATIMSEYSNTRTRGAFIGAVFAMQGFGILSGATVAIILAASFNHYYSRPPFIVDHIHSTPPQADFVWRMLFMFGAVPAACTYYYRMRMPETARYTALVEKNTGQAARDMASVLHVQFDEGSTEIRHPNDAQIQVEEKTPKDAQYTFFSREFIRRHLIHLIGTTTCWFLLDVAFYSQNLFQKDIFTAVGWIPAAKTMSALEEMFKISRAQALIALVSTVPGYWVTVATIDKIGRWVIQFMGFSFMTLFMLILTIDYYKLRGDPCSYNKDKFCGGNHFAFIALYALTFFFSNFGPNSTTFVVPAELFPARFRSTCHGISAAAGKAGAIVGTFGFLWASQNPHEGKQDHGYPTGIGIKKSLLILAITNAFGVLFTFLVPETKGKSLEELSGEAEEENTR